MALLLIFNACDESKTPTQVVDRGTPIEGNLTGVLDASESPYLAVDTLFIPENSELVITPGVEIRFETGIPFEIRGKITAQGTENSPITFTSGAEFPERGDWDGIWMFEADEASNFEYCKFLFGAKYGRRYHYKEYGEGLIDSTVWEYGNLTLVNSNPTITKSWFLVSGFHAVHCDSGSKPTIENCVFYDNAGHGIYVDDEADPSIKYNIIIENDDYGVFCAMPSSNPRPELDLQYNIVWSNFSGEFNQLAPSRLGRISTMNGNLDSCDYQYNLRLNPEFVDPVETWDFRLNPWSSAIDAGPEDANLLDSDDTRMELGIYHYTYRPGEIRRLLEVDKLEQSSSPYTMSFDVILPAGHHVTIEPGVEILVEGRFKFKCNGLLTSVGTASNPITFTSAAEEPGMGDWIGILLPEGGPEGVELKYTNIEYARFGVQLTRRNATIENCRITTCDSVGIFCNDYSAPTITDCELIDNSIAGILCQYNSSPVITGNSINGGTGYGIYAREHSMPEITNNVIFDVATNGIKLENLSSAEIVNNTIALNGYFGLTCLNNSKPNIRNNIFYMNGTELRGGQGIVAERSARPDIEYNCFWAHPISGVSVSGDSTVSATNLYEDPDFVDAEGGNFHLKSGSPCLDNGDPSIGSLIGALGN